MQVDSEYSINFYSTELNQVKYNKLLLKANIIREFKNKISKKICQNPLDFIQLSKIDFLMKYNTQITNLVGREIQPALTDIYKNYQNKIEDFNNKNRIKIQDNIKIDYYKKSTKKNKKGELKSFKIHFKSTDFNKVVSYLVKYYNDNTINYIITEINNNSNILPEKLKFYNNILYFLDKFGDRLLKLVYFKRKNILEATFREPINFKSLTYTAINTKNIININKNINSDITHFINLTGFNCKFSIPVKYNKEYHGRINDFNIKDQVTYKIMFIKDKIRIVLYKNNTRNYEENKENIVGCDVNLKHNLFCLSNGIIIDFDRKLIKNYVKTKLKLDKKNDLMYKTENIKLNNEEKDKKYKLIERELKWLRRLNYHYNELASKLIKILKDNEYDHLVMEDLNLTDKSFLRSEEFFNIKFSRLVRMLHLSNFKNIFNIQCSNKNIQLSIVPSFYTSQRCSKCGFIHPDNRKTQEEFICLSCGCKDNADHNAANNIKDFKSIDVLSNKLLKVESNGWFVSKTKKTETKKILDDFYYSYNTLETKLV